jgi:hypothetical protein
VNGGDVIALLKNGTNEFNGSAFYFVNDYKLDANSWANDYTKIPKTSTTSNIVGDTRGGPIIKDRLFLGDYSGNRYHAGGVATATVADAAYTTGELLNPAIMCLPSTTGTNISPVNSMIRRTATLRS